MLLLSCLFCPYFFALHSPADGTVDMFRASCLLLYSFNVHNIPSPPASQHTRSCCCEILPLSQTGLSISRHRHVSCPKCLSNSLAGAVQGAEALPFCPIKVGLQSASLHNFSKFSTCNITSCDSNSRKPPGLNSCLCR